MKRKEKTKFVWRQFLFRFAHIYGRECSSGSNSITMNWMFECKGLKWIRICCDCISEIRLWCWHRRHQSSSTQITFSECNLCNSNVDALTSNLKMSEKKTFIKTTFAFERERKIQERQITAATYSLLERATKEWNWEPFVATWWMWQLKETKIATTEFIACRYSLLVEHHHLHNWIIEFS